MTTKHSDAGQVENLIERLAGHDVRYFDVRAAKRESAHTQLAPLLEDLARAPTGRLRSALVALLLRHPEHAPTAEVVARKLHADDPPRRLLLLSVVVAAALQSEWSFSLDLYIPHRVHIQADQLAAELGLPSPSVDYGRPCLAACARLLRSGDAFPTNYADDWENAAHRLLSQLARESHPSGA